MICRGGHCPPVLRFSAAPCRADALIGPKAPSTKRGLAERSEVWGSLKKLLPLYEEGERADRVVRPYKGIGGFFVKKVLYFLGVLWYLKQDGALAPETPLSVLGQRRIFTSAHT